MESPALLVRQHWSRHQSRIRLLSRYLTGQGLLQGVNVLNGFFLLRWLSLDEQAKFSLAMGLQATLGLLGDLGFGGSLLGLVGSRTDDKMRIGQYIRGIQWYKNRLLLISLPVGTVLVAYYGRRQGWGLDFWGMYALLLFSIQAQSRSAYYAAVLQMKGRLGDFYRPQLLTSALRLGVSFALFCADNLNALAVVALTTFGFTLSAERMKRSALAYFTPAPRPEPFISREIVRTLAPVMPMAFFYAVQGQLITFMMGIFGQAQHIAEVGALARIGQLFALLGPFNTVVLLPYFARSTAEQLPRRFSTVLLGATGLMVPFVAVAYAFPGALVQLLGPKFSALRPEIGPYVTASAIYYVSSVLWAINMARRWNTGYGTLLYVGLTLGVQAGGVAVLDVATTHGAVRLSLLTALATTFGYLAASVAGLLKRQTPELSPETMMTVRRFFAKALHAVSHRYVPASLKLPGLYWAYCLDNPEPELQHLPRLLTGRRTAVDVGANVGYWTYRLAGLFGRVVSFELNEDCYRHIEAHRLRNVTLHRHGLSNVQTLVHFYLPVLANGFVSHGWGTVEAARKERLFERWQTRSYEVKPLDAYALTDVDFIKIDVEGHELPVVEGAMQTIRKNRPLLLIETDAENLQTLTDWLVPLGYRMRSLRELIRVAGSEGNYLFIPPAAAELQRLADR